MTSNQPPYIRVRCGIYHFARRVPADLHRAFGDVGELEVATCRAFHDHFKKEIKISDEIGVMLSSSSDGKEFEDLTVEETADKAVECCLWIMRTN